MNYDVNDVHQQSITVMLFLQNMDYLRSKNTNLLCKCFFPSASSLCNNQFDCVKHQCLSVNQLH